MNKTVDTPFLETRDLGKQYPGNLALDAVNISAMRGEIHAIVGANGAGKSTLMNILAGATRQTAGEIFMDGSPQTFASPAGALSAGIACVYQELSLVSQLDVARNVYLGREPKTNWGTIDTQRLYSDTKALLDRYGLNIKAGAQVEELSVAEQQMVELARALSFDSRVLILDEPTSVLSLAEKENLFGIIRSLKDAGLLIIYVSHFLGEVIEIADRVTVIRDGKLIATHHTQTMNIDALAALITGVTETRDASRELPAATNRGERIAIRIERSARPVEMDIHEGEIVGIAGLVGSGRTDFAKAIAGAGKVGNRVTLKALNKTTSFKTVRQAISNGVIYLTEDRKRDGLYSSLDVIANTAASSLDSMSASVFRRPGKEQELARTMLEQLKIVTARFDIPVTKLSGGNQQKVLIARALMTQPKLLICDEPTRGVDIAAKAQIHRILRGLAEQGVAIIVISSENEELLSLTDRIVIMRAGSLAGEMATGETDETQLLIAISGNQNDEVLN